MVVPGKPSSLVRAPCADAVEVGAPQGHPNRTAGHLEASRRFRWGEGSTLPRSIPSAHSCGNDSPDNRVRQGEVSVHDPEHD